MTTVIKVENLSKAYRLGQIGGKTLSEDINRWWARLRRRPDPTAKIGHGHRGNVEDQTVWALRDVSFEVKQGEVLGIIGRNGAGKSTLLKILSRITAPTSGLVKIKGRVGSLLEVGTGFHPELTGRENIYLNGAILGMEQTEIDAKFDEIVDFSEVGEFIDTPVKRYSSGMHVRLAFSVAAHLDPEILLVDEVLAVVDIAFQNKCLGKMEGVAKQGRTVLFVSHNMATIISLCPKSLLIDKGSIVTIGPSSNVVQTYLNQVASHTIWEQGFQQANDTVRIEAFSITQNGEQKHFYDYQHPIQVAIKYEINAPVNNLLLGFDLHNSDGIHLFRSYDLEKVGLDWREPGRYCSTLEIPGSFFRSGKYYADLLVALHRKRWISRNEARVSFNISENKKSDVDYFGTIQPIGKWRITDK